VEAYRKKKKDQPEAHLTIAVGMEVDKAPVSEEKAYLMEVDNTSELVVEDLPMDNAEASTLHSSTAIVDAEMNEAGNKAIEDEVVRYFADSI
jgi:hypothetical protein